MLDQNTDRMWYVIGAVIVGAAIILILNTAFPQLFASVGDTFKGKTDATTAVVDGIMPKKPTDGINRLKHGDVELKGSQRMNADGSIFINASQPEYLQHEDIAPIIEKFGLNQTYTLSFDLKSQDTSKHDKINVYMQSGSGTKYYMVNQNITVTEDYQSFTIQGLKAIVNPTNETLAEPYKTANISFYGIYRTGNIPVVKNVRLERER